MPKNRPPAKKSRNDGEDMEAEDADETEYMEEGGGPNANDGQQAEGSKASTKSSGSGGSGSGGNKRNQKFKQIGSPPTGKFPVTDSKGKTHNEGVLGNLILELFEDDTTSAGIISAGLSFAVGRVFQKLSGPTGPLNAYKGFIDKNQYDNIHISLLWQVQNCVMNAVTNNGKDQNQAGAKIACSFDYIVDKKTQKVELNPAEIFKDFNKMTGFFGVTFSDSAGKDLTTQKSSVMGALRTRAKIIKSATSPKAALAKRITGDEGLFPLFLGAEFNGNHLAAGAPYLPQGTHLLKVWGYLKDGGFGAEKQVKNEKGKITYLKNTCLNKSPPALRHCVEYVLAHPKSITQQGLGLLISLFSLYQQQPSLPQVPFPSEVLRLVGKKKLAEIKEASENRCAGIIWVAAKVPRNVFAKTQQLAAAIGHIELWSAFGLYESANTMARYTGVHLANIAGIFTLQSLTVGTEAQLYRETLEGSVHYLSVLDPEKSSKKAPKIGSPVINTGIKAQPHLHVFSNIQDSGVDNSGIIIPSRDAPVKTISSTHELFMECDKLRASAKNFFPITEEKPAFESTFTGYHLGLRRDDINAETFFDPKKNPLLAYAVAMRLTNPDLYKEVTECMNELHYLCVDSGNWDKIRTNDKGNIMWSQSIPSEKNARAYMSMPEKHKELVKKRKSNTFGIGAAKKKLADYRRMARRDDLDEDLGQDE